MKVLKELLEIILDSVVGTVFICIGVSGYVTYNGAKFMKLLFMLIVLFGVTGIQLGAATRANKKYKKEDEE